MTKIKVVNKSGLPLPEYTNPNDAGVDLRASFKEGVKDEFLFHSCWDDKESYLIIFSGGRALIPTNLYTAIPEGFEVQIRPRSGLALKHGISVLNTPGTIDADYIASWGVILQNFGEEPFIVKDGERIAQAVLKKVENIEWVDVDNLEETKRGLAGFGDSGKK